MVVLVHFLRRSSTVPGQQFGNGLHHVAVMDRRLSHNYLQWSEKIEGQSCWLAKWTEVQSIWINFFFGVRIYWGHYYDYIISQYVSPSWSRDLSVKVKVDVKVRVKVLMRLMTNELQHFLIAMPDHFSLFVRWHIQPSTSGSLTDWSMAFGPHCWSVWEKWFPWYCIRW